ncbi:sugar transporter [gut metagenome]|uniref:Sugar transporter n=1 Tax=gut metagenome TaxID=749906 RepID=J9GRQ2_9ZZZZ
MAFNLWTNHFMRICIANLLLFSSLYVLFPVLPVEMASRLGVSVAQTGVVFLFFTLGMFLMGPFYAYLVDVYKRKHVCLYAMAAMVAATSGYAFVNNLNELLLLCMVQGMAFGVATTADITLAIDVTNTTLRSAGNVGLSWMARLGMMLGLMSGACFHSIYTFENLLSFSILLGVVAMLAVMGVYVPFRAPIVTKFYSFDRFLLLRGWVPAFNIMLVMFVPGLFIPLAHPFLEQSLVGGSAVFLPLFGGVGAGYLLSLFASRLFFMKGKMTRKIMIGLGLEILAVSLIGMTFSLLAPSLLLGLGLGLVLPEFLRMFVKLSLHCQRGTANTTHLLFSELGIALGIAAACVLTREEMLHVGELVAAAALLFFAFVTYPYVKRNRVR